MRWSVLARGLGLFCCLFGTSVVAVPSPSGDTRAVMRGQIEQVLKATHVPGASVAWVAADGTTGTEGVGLADVASHTPATSKTLFRIGSVSKGLTALAVLQQVDAGRLRLGDAVTAHIGSAWFVNRYEAESPTTIADLLEHTTGWDDMHLREYAKDAAGMTLTEGLRFETGSRVARWAPGTRMAYCNSGPAVAALVVEHLTGTRIEDYVATHLFAPIGMATATYDEPNGVPIATLYHDDGTTPFRYWHILFRPAGSINASAEDMAAYLHFYLSRGTVNGQHVVSTGALTRMETPTRAWSAQAGLTTGYGLANYTSIEDGFVFHGHDGGVEGGLARLRYLPEAGVGYSVVINGGNADALKRISDLLRAHVLEGVPRPALPTPGAVPREVLPYAGWYRLDSPRQQSDAFALRLLDWKRIGITAAGLTVYPLWGSLPQHFVPVAGYTFRIPDAPAATLALAQPEPALRVLLLGTETYVRVAPWQVAVEGVAATWSLLSVLAGLLYGAGATVTAVLGRRRQQDRSIRCAMAAAAFSLTAVFVLPSLVGDAVIERLGNPTIWSVGLCAVTLLYAATVLWLAVTVMRPQSGARAWVRRVGRLTAVGQCTILVYLAWWGVIGLRTWV